MFATQSVGTIVFFLPLLILGSSMAEHPAVNRRVAGSSPARGASLRSRFARASARQAAIAPGLPRRALQQAEAVSPKLAQRAKADISANPDLYRRCSNCVRFESIEEILRISCGPDLCVRPQACTDSRSGSFTFCEAFPVRPDTTRESQTTWSLDSSGTTMARAVTLCIIAHGRSSSRWSFRPKRQHVALRSI